MRRLRPGALLLILVLILVVGRYFGYLRAAGAVAMGATIFYLGFSYFRSAGASQPDPEIEDVSDESLRYVCTMCGLELKIEVAASDRAPSHCREKMVLVQGPRRPPLHPV
jgi:hypothetical protein